ncbi:MAG TPA: hypothetical protein VG797_03580, partial [Phycisphaerales bacterium]|nr:hypothetical protein [Phycisphaerales bacterium]
VSTGAQLPTADGPPPDGRGYGWLWMVAYEFAHRAIPDIANRSVVVTLLAPVGAGVLVLLWRAAVSAGRGRAAFITLIGMLGWLMAQTMNHQVWQRYFEPMVLLFLALLTAAGVAARARPDLATRSNTVDTPASGPEGRRAVAGGRSSDEIGTQTPGPGSLASAPQRGAGTSSIPAWLPWLGIAALAAIEFALSAMTLFREIIKGS